MSTIVFTGFPGFLGSELLPRVLLRHPGDTALCIVQSRFLPLARERAAGLVAAEPSLAGRIVIEEGDITRPGLGLADPGAVARSTREIYHLAAVYDLSVKRDVAMRVNVDGTRHVLDFAEGITALERIHYVSTCYVSGRHAGVFTEEDLDKGQVFNNFYEETKYLAEVDVQRRMRGGMPTTIYRPSVVAGDSATGATQKFDGSYYVIRWILKQPRVAILPVVGDPSAFRFNTVPRDFVVDALAHLSGLAASKGKVYHLSDPDPLTVDEIIDEIARATGRRILRVPITLGLARGAIDYLPGVYRLMEIPSSAINYFTHPTHYTSANTVADLAGSGIAAPRLTTYLRNLADFVRANPKVSSAAMV